MSSMKGNTFKHERQAYILKQVNLHNKVYAQDEKKRIAQKALKLIKPGMTVLTEAGTTLLELVRVLPRKLEATFFTVSPLAALNLAEYPYVHAVLLGGEIDMTSQITLGARTVSELSMIKVDLCIMGVNAINTRIGLAEIDWRVAQVKKAYRSEENDLINAWAKQNL